MLQQFSNLPLVLLMLVLLGSACGTVVDITSSPPTLPDPFAVSEVKTNSKDNEFPTSKTAPTKSTSNITAPTKSTSEDTIPTKSTSEDTIPTKSTPKGTAPTKSVPKGTTTTVTSSYTSTPQDTVSEVKTKSKDSELTTSITALTTSTSENTSPTKSLYEDTTSTTSLSKGTAPTKSVFIDTRPTMSISKGTAPTTSVSKGITYTVTSSSYTTTPQDTVTLKKKDCASVTDKLSGKFKNFEDLVMSSRPNEGQNMTFVCKMKNIIGCQRFISSLVNSTQLYLTHHKNISEDWVLDYKSKIMDSDDEDVLFSIEFIFSLSYIKHHEGSVYCKATDNDSLVVVSPTKWLGRVNKQYHVHMTPLQVETEVGTKFNLTCTVSDAEALQHLEWKWKKESLPLYTTIVKSDINDKYQINEVGNLKSVLTINEAEEWKGTYKCTVETYGNYGYKTASVVIRPKDLRAVHGTTISLSIVAVLLVILVVGIILRRRALKKKIEISMMLMELQEANTNAQNATRDGLGSVHSLVLEPAVNCYASNSMNPDGGLGQETLTATFARLTSMYAHWQKDRTTLVIKHIVGEGNFGSVCLGIMPDVLLQGVSSQVAVKTIKPARMDKQAIADFEKEVSIMTSLRHDNIVSLIGLCTETMPLYIIMEYMGNGPLNSFLMDKAPNKLEDTSLSTQDMLFMGLQPCRALEYLSNKNIVHRDISARNCLVGDKLVVKLADFGLSRGTAVDDGKNYYKKDGGMVPVKWMAPEALNFGKYTSANDVWAFGVLMWEIFSFGAIPYQSHSNQQVIVFVNRGGRLEKPDYCPLSIWQHICLCWTQAPEDRLTIGGVVNMISTELDILSSCASSTAQLY